ncbi:MAG: PEP-CTERM sorting domain-containing protein [Verrucomicrobia bacterium]|nr:PEP-CTERM sorting domain-containing protein [Verrucomicrobiota bacterium]
MRSFLCLLALGACAASAYAQAVFDNTGAVGALPSGVVASGPGSLSFNAVATQQLGDYVVLGGTDRTLTNVSLPMAIFAGGAGGSVAVNPFVLPITLNIYAVDTSSGTPAAGVLLNSITQPVNIPGVPAGNGNRVYFNVDFSAVGLNITLPNSFIWSVAYDASSGSAASLNAVVADAAPASPSTGGYGDPNAIFIETDFLTGNFERATFADLGFFFRPVARFDAIPEPSTVVLLSSLGLGALVWSRRRR